MSLGHRLKQDTSAGGQFCPLGECSYKTQPFSAHHDLFFPTKLEGGKVRENNIHLDNLRHFANVAMTKTNCRSLPDLDPPCRW